MDELSPRQVAISDAFWSPRQLINARKAIFHQWEQLEASHCIDNFRLAVGEIVGFREGLFFADSDAYKWLEAASDIYALWPSTQLKRLIDDFIDLVQRAQKLDGYIFTYNQIHFPHEPRWQNMFIEHELYCHGHLIEAGVSHYLATGEKTALEIACRVADMLATEFLVSSSDKTSGHEEIEIALLRLYKVTGNGKYLELARQFIERRGKFHPFGLLILFQNANVNRRGRIIRTLRHGFQADHPEYLSFQLPADNYAKTKWSVKFRFLLSALTGKFFQMHVPIRKQTIPVGHSVRFTYLETAIASLYRQDPDHTLLSALQAAWERMVTRRMYLTGGIGSLPELEGFGRDYELDPELAYTETCAALGSLFWNWEMTLITSNARYADLFEWQLYNAAAVGMGLNGDTYLYNNPLTCRGGVTRRPWYLVPCCPSNLSRTWAILGKYIFSTQGSDLWVHQYIGCRSDVNLDQPLRIEMQSGLPWEGKVRILLSPNSASDWTIWLRIPSWADQFSLQVNGQIFDIPPLSPQPQVEAPASGFDPRQSWYLPVRRIWEPGDRIELDFLMPIILRRASPRVRVCSGKVALTRGPLVYCLESMDNPDLDIFSSQLDPSSLKFEFSPTLLGGTGYITGKTAWGQSLTFIPYNLWANRGASQMTVWVNA